MKKIAIFKVVVLAFLSLSWLFTDFRAGAFTRKLEIRGEKDLAKVIRINEIANADSVDFPKGFQLSITNVSDKPIFHINIVFVFTKTNRVLGRSIISRLQYGASRMVDLRERATSEDQPLKPGEACLLKVNDRQAQDIIDHLHLYGDEKELLNEAELHINIINFGDGTGYGPGKSSIEYKTVSSQ